MVYIRDAKPTSRYHCHRRFLPLTAWKLLRLVLCRLRLGSKSLLPSTTQHIALLREIHVKSRHLPIPDGCCSCENWEYD